MLNHIPVLGTAFGLALLAWALFKRSEELKRVSLGVLVIVALFAIPAYLTGEPAEEAIEHLPGVNEEAIEEHEDAAKFAFAGVLVLGAVALGALILFRRGKPAPALGSHPRACPRRACLCDDGQNGEPRRAHTAPRAEFDAGRLGRSIRRRTQGDADCDRRLMGPWMIRRFTQMDADSAD